MKRMNDLRRCAAASSRAGVRSLFSGDRLRAWLHTGGKGQSLVEFAMVLPVLMAIVTGIFAFSVALYNKETLVSAVDAGGRELQIIRSSTTDPCADTLTAIENAAPSLTSSQISLTIVMNGVTVSGSSCPGDESDLIQGQPVTVTATYPCVLPIYGAKFAASCQLAAQVTEFEN